MKNLIVVLLSFLLISCAKDPSSTSVRDREKTNSTPRGTVNTTGDTSSTTEETVATPPSSKGTDKFEFPIQSEYPLKIKSTDNKRLHIYTKEGKGSMFVLAPQKGVLSFVNLKDHYHITIKASNERKLNFILERAKTELKVKSSAQVNQKQILAKTTGTVVLYITENGTDLTLCLGDIKSKNNLPVEKENVDNCN